VPPADWLSGTSAELAAGLLILFVLSLVAPFLGMSFESCVSTLRSGRLPSRLPLAIGAAIAAVRRASDGHFGPTRIPGHPRTRAHPRDGRGKPVVNPQIGRAHV
jgi:hypothetical protein